MFLCFVVSLVPIISSCDSHRMRNIHIEISRDFIDMSFIHVMTLQACHSPRSYQGLHRNTLTCRAGQTTREVISLKAYEYISSFHLLSEKTLGRRKELSSHSMQSWKTIHVCLMYADVVLHLRGFILSQYTSRDTVTLLTF